MVSQLFVICDLLVVVLGQRLVRTLPKANRNWALPQKANLDLLEANKALGTEPLAVASGTKTQAEI